MGLLKPSGGSPNQQKVLLRGNGALRRASDLFPAALMPLSLNGHILVLAMAAIAFFSTPLHRTLWAKKPQLQEVPLRVERLQRGLGLHCLRVYEGMDVWMREAGVSSMCFGIFNLGTCHASAV